MSTMIRMALAAAIAEAGEHPDVVLEATYGWVSPFRRLQAYGWWQWNRCHQPYDDRYATRRTDDRNLHHPTGDNYRT